MTPPPVSWTGVPNRFPVFGGREDRTRLSVTLPERRVKMDIGAVPRQETLRRKCEGHLCAWTGTCARVLPSPPIRRPDE